MNALRGFTGFGPEAGGESSGSGRGGPEELGGVLADVRVLSPQRGAS